MALRTEPRIHEALSAVRSTRVAAVITRLDADHDVAKDVANGRTQQSQNYNHYNGHQNKDQRILDLLQLDLN